MFWRVGAWSLVAIIMAGCAATERSGADFGSLAQKIGPPRPGQARIVVFREKAYAGIIDKGWDVKLDGGPLADLKTGTYVYADRPTGRHQLTATMDVIPGLSQRDVSAESGRTYFFLARLSERSKTLNAMTAAAGLTGLVVAAAVTSGNDNPGPLDFFPMNETDARPMMADLRLAP
jgi:hypothetical protein